MQNTKVISFPLGKYVKHKNYKYSRRTVSSPTFLESLGTRAGIRNFSNADEKGSNARTLNLPSIADVVVIGGGAVGASTAFHLAKRGVDVTLVERHK